MRIQKIQSEKDAVEVARAVLEIKQKPTRMFGSFLDGKTQDLLERMSRRVEKHLARVASGQFGAMSARGVH